MKDIRAGQIMDQRGVYHSMTKVQPVPSSTQDSKTVRVERSTLSLRKARNNKPVRDFVEKRIVPYLEKRPGKSVNSRVMLPALGLVRVGGRKATELSPNLKIFANAMSTTAKSFTAIRIFRDLFPEMFQVTTESQNSNIIKLISSKLPPLDTDPTTAPSSSGDVSQRLRNDFQKYARGLKEHITKEGSLTISKAGIYLNSQPGFREAFQNTPGLGKDGGTKKILEALGFRIIPVPGKMPLVRNPT